MLEKSLMPAILQLYSQVTDILGNVFVKRIDIRLFYLLARFHYILNHPRRLLYSPIRNWIISISDRLHPYLGQ